MTQDQTTIRWAALSLSSIAAVFLPDILLARDATESVKHQLVAVSTTGGVERANVWLREHKISDPESVKVFGSWEEMLEGGDFDVVYISTPHPLHYRHVMKALKCRRHVLVEKPATINRRQYETLVAEAKQNNVVMMEAMWTRYLPAAVYLRDELLPRIGEVKRIHADFSFPIVSADLPDSSRFLDKGAGAGSLLDQGVYALTWADIALNGLGGNEITEVVHASSISVPGRPGNVDDINTIVLSKKMTGSSPTQSAVGIVTTSMTLPGSNKPSFYRRLQAKKAAPSVRIEATEASVAIPFPPIRPEELHIQWYGSDKVDGEGAEREEIIRKPVERGWGIWYQADVIAQRILQRQRDGLGQGEVIGAAESLRVLGWMDTARQHAGIVYDPQLEEL